METLAHTHIHTAHITLFGYNAPQTYFSLVKNLLWQNWEIYPHYYLVFLSTGITYGAYRYTGILTFIYYTAYNT